MDEYLGPVIKDGESVAPAPDGNEGINALKEALRDGLAR